MVGKEVEDDEVGVKDDAGGPSAGPEELMLLVTCTYDFGALVVCISASN